MFLFCPEDIPITIIATCHNSGFYRRYILPDLLLDILPLTRSLVRLNPSIILLVSSDPLVFQISFPNPVLVFLVSRHIFYSLQTFLGSLVTLFLKDKIWTTFPLSPGRTNIFPSSISPLTKIAGFPRTC